ncbi:hypothetical protein JQM66_10645 [Oscillibacter valericigenes]|uniref:hypothetical protein n=1 Tax=Oscillibacter valericigenes TaxID=351091 RepID=UPI001F459DAE|nr:hypothetical protein [Oscillibacter valericigenes]MCF2665013.1 hypothetical protein [Oscillibacter valericigenes]
MDYKTEEGKMLNTIVKKVPAPDPCFECSVCQSPSVSLMEECFRLSSVSLSSDYPVVKMQTDISDLVEYSTSSGTQFFLPNSIFLESTIDSYLLRYYLANAELYETPAYMESLPSTIQGSLENYFKLPVKKRRPLVDPLPIRLHGEFCYSEFAIAAKEDLLCKALYMYKNASAQSAALNYMGTFFSGSIFSNQHNYCSEKYPSSLPVFKLEDYVFYELHTRISFVIEACSALLEIQDMENYEICKSALISSLHEILCVPSILSGIFVMRQCILESIWSLEYTPYSSSIVKDIHKKPEMPTKRQVVNSAFSHVLHSWSKGSLLYSDPCNVSMEKLNLCQSNALELLSATKSPINVMEYVENPCYGPVAFCNPSHRGVKRYLDDLELLNSCSSNNKWRSKGKHWLLFQEIYQAVHKFLPIPPILPNSFQRTARFE